MLTDGGRLNFSERVARRVKQTWHRPAAMSAPLLGEGRLQVLDIGARSGPKDKWRDFAHLVELVGVEPDPGECERLERRASASPIRSRYLCTALAARPGTLELHLCAHPGCSSVFEPNRSHLDQFFPEIAALFEVVGKRTVDATTLDRLVADHALAPDVIELDVQGAELSILEGGLETLPDVRLIELEVEFCEQYLGQPLFGDVDRFLRDHGFELLGLRRTLWRRHASSPPRSVGGGQLVHGDALYFNRRLLRRIASREDVVRWLIALSAHHQYDFVEFLMQHHSHLLEGERIARSDFIPRRSWIWNSLQHLMSRCYEPHHLTLRSWMNALRSDPAPDWHDPDWF